MIAAKLFLCHFSALIKCLLYRALTSVFFLSSFWLILLNSTQPHTEAWFIPPHLIPSLFYFVFKACDVRLLFVGLSVSVQASPVHVPRSWCVPHVPDLVLVVFWFVLSFVFYFSFLLHGLTCLYLSCFLEVLDFEFWISLDINSLKLAFCFQPACITQHQQQLYLCCI